MILISIPIEPIGIVGNYINISISKIVWTTVWHFDGVSKYRPADPLGKLVWTSRIVGFNVSHSFTKHQTQTPTPKPNPTQKTCTNRRNFRNDSAAKDPLLSRWKTPAKNQIAARTHGEIDVFARENDLARKRSARKLPRKWIALTPLYISNLTY